MSVSAHLLRMLEPAVRPGNLPASDNGQATTPIESQSFEQLLAGAQEKLDVDVQAEESQEVDGSTKPVTGDAKSPPVLPELTGLDRIENASLRLMFEQRDDVAKE